MRPVLDQCFKVVGNKGLYQKLIIPYLFLIAAQVNFLLLGPTLIYMNPLFQCEGIQGIVDQAVACLDLSKCRIQNEFTIVARNYLYCGDGQLMRSFIQAMLPIGSIVGLFFMGWLGDTKGRKLAMNIAHLVAVASLLLTLAGGYYLVPPLLFIAQFAGGFSGYSMILMAYVLPYEFCEGQFSKKTIVIINYAWAITISLMGVIYYEYNNWVHFLGLIVLIPLFVSLCLSLWYHLDSPEFLLGSGKVSECREVLQKIARYNGTLMRFNEVDRLLSTFQVPSVQIQEQSQFKLITQTKGLVKLIIQLTLMEMGACVYYFGSNYALNEIGKDYGSNMIASGLVELLAFVSMTFALDRIPIRNGILCCYIVTVSLGMLFLLEFVSQNTTLSLVILGITRFCSTVAYTLVILLITESFPMKIRFTCAGIVEGLAQLGCFIAPLIITFAIDFIINGIVVLSVFLLILTIIPLLGVSPKINRQEENTLSEPLKLSAQVSSETLNDASEEERKHL